MAVQQALFGIDDAITGSFNGGLRGALLGAGNNATMLAMQLGGVKAQIYTIGAVAAAQIGVRLYGYLTDTTGQAKKLEDHLERVRTLQSKIFDDASKRSARPTDFEGADTKSLKKSREDSLITLHDAEAELEKLDQANLRLKDQQKAYQADKKFLEERTLRQKADDYLNQTFPLAAENSLNKDAHARLNRLNSIDPQLEEKLKDTNKAIEKGGQRERELREQIELERENVRNAEDEGFRAEERENKEKLQKKEELMQKEARLAERKQKLLDKQARDLKNHSQKIEDFRLKAFGGQGAEESVLAKLASDIQEARELLKGGELQQAEAQLTRSAEEKLAKLSISQRPEFRETKNPALALADSDRARQIVLGAGNQMLDARTRIDKHHSAMEQLTAEVASGIKEMVAEAKRDIEVFLVED